MDKKLTIQTGKNNLILRKKSTELSKEEIQKIGENFFNGMIARMFEDDGIGLAAPQIGVNKRFVIIGKSTSPTNENLILINPKITTFSKKTNILEEGCLSLPGIYADVNRSSKIRFKAINEKGEKIEFKAKGIFSRVVQHEIDHLDGILFIDRAE